MPATAIGAVAPADMFFPLLFRNDQHPVAADRQSEAAIALEDNPLRLVGGVQKGDLKSCNCKWIRLFNLSNINKNTLAGLMVALKKVDENADLRRIKTGIEANMQIFMDETMTDIQGLHGGAGRIHTFLRVAGV